MKAIVRAGLLVGGAVVAFSFSMPAVFAASIPTGRILETVACSADPAQTYALYLPTAFDPNRKWPVLLCFDPGARGKAPVERFQAAAEMFGWIVAGSNNSRNGPWDANAAAISAMVKDLGRHLPIDSKRLYAAGHSGGARVACQLAVGGMVQGVIASCAGFGGSETPAKVPFLFFGATGVTDFNYRELRRVDRELDDIRAVHRVVVFDGGHEWLPASLATEALAWLELHAMRAGTREKDTAWIQAQFEARMAAVPAEPLLENYRATKSVAGDFKGFVDVATMERRSTEISRSRELKEALKTERASERAEEAWLEKLLEVALEGRASLARKSVAELQAKANGTGPERAMAVRVLHSVASTCGESAREALRNHEYDSAASLLEMTTLLRPERPQGHFDLARARALLGEKKKAIEALQQAIAIGFRDRDRIDGEKAFDKIRMDPGFAAAVEALR